MSRLAGRLRRDADSAVGLLPDQVVVGADGDVRSADRGRPICRCESAARSSTSKAHLAQRPPVGVTLRAVVTELTRDMPLRAPWSG